MVDDKTYKIERQDFLKVNKKQKKSKINKYRQALQAVHINLHVSEVVICPIGVANAATCQNINNAQEVPIFIDGIKINEPAKKMVVKRFKKDKT